MALLVTYEKVEYVSNIFDKQTLETLNPGILGPSSPTKLEKNPHFKSLAELEYRDGLTPCFL